MGDTKGVMAREYLHTPDGKLVLTDQFWSDTDIEACFGAETIVRAVLRRAQEAEALLSASIENSKVDDLPKAAGGHS